ncbi:MAG TPA: ATP-binding protein, partial [Phototrophicaceae bacterium]|nr:ATP-binding protein [Phototrophicaceae bacterium]
MVKITPINNPLTDTVDYYLYVKISTNEAEADKQEIINLFLAGSVATVLATSLILFVLIYRMILSRLSATLNVVQTVEKGDLTVRATNPGSRDEIGVLQTGVNSMISRLEELVGSLEQKVKTRTEQLDLARQQAESASNAKSLFLSNMSHELRTPLNMVIGYTSSMLHMPLMYQNQSLPEVFRPDIQLIQDNGQYLLGLINDILDLSKIESGKFDLQFGVVDVIIVLNGVIATSTGLLKDKPVQIRPDFDLDLPRVWADSMRLRQILLNLMSNAIKFTDTGNVTLSAHVQGDQVTFSVMDTGVGISEEAVNVIFDRFQQASQKDAIQGTGLGLDISQRLAQMHGTKINVKSSTGQGSTFSFSLPVATPEQLVGHSDRPAVVKDTTVKLLEPTQWDTVSSKHTILLIEDDADTRVMLHRILEAADYILMDASDSAQGLDLATGMLPDLIIMDILLPDGSGWDLIQKLRDDHFTASTPIIVLSNALDKQRAE